MVEVGLKHLTTFWLTGKCGEEKTIGRGARGYQNHPLVQPGELRYETKFPHSFSIQLPWCRVVLSEVLKEAIDKGCRLSSLELLAFSMRK